jgi:purine-cytosine permease-like protein
MNSNFKSLEEQKLANKTLIYGLPLCIIGLLLTIFYFDIVDKILGFLLVLIYLIPVIALTKEHFLTKRILKASDDYTFYSNWYVLGVIFLGSIQITCLFTIITLLK